MASTSRAHRIGSLLFCPACGTLLDLPKDDSDEIACNQCGRIEPASCECSSKPAPPPLPPINPPASITSALTCRPLSLCLSRCQILALSSLQRHSSVPPASLMGASCISCARYAPRASNQARLTGFARSIRESPNQNLLLPTRLPEPAEIEEGAGAEQGQGWRGGKGTGSDCACCSLFAPRFIHASTVSCIMTCTMPCSALTSR